MGMLSSPLNIEKSIHNLENAMYINGEMIKEIKSVNCGKKK